MVNCIACNSDKPVRLGTMCRLALGNEEIYTLYRCPDCEKYFLDCYEDIFIPVNNEPDPRWTRGPYDKETGDLLLKLINECPDSLDKYCECAAHDRFFKEVY